MSDSAFPKTIHRALVAATLVAVLGLAIHQPTVLVAVLSGIVLGAGITGLSGRPSRVTLAAALFPVGLVTFAVSVAGIPSHLLEIGETSRSLEFADLLYNGIVVLVGALLGLVFVSTVTGEVTKRTRSNADMSTLTGVVFGGLLAVVVSILVNVGSSSESILFVFGTTLGGFALTVMLTAIGLILSILLVPRAGFTSPSRRDVFEARRQRFAGVIFVLMLFVVLVPATAYQVGAETVASALIESAIARALLFGVSTVCVVIILAGTIAGYTWKQTESQQNDVAPVIIGTCLGVAVLLGTIVTLDLSTGLLFAVPVLVGAGGVVLWMLWWLYGAVGRDETVSDTLPGVLTVLCVVGTLGIGADIGQSLRLGPSGLGAVLTLSAGLFIYSVGRYGRTLSKEVGTATRRPQLVQIAASGTIIGLGALVALVGFVISMTIVPQFSAAATVGLVGALLTLVVLVNYLRTRQPSASP